ncbi:MAG TPA: hypothetical protein VLL48_07460, partial [Longimicrobiales bacterium]|nr:hypothetical protein [Longimicrobiales bacterium]
EAVLVHNDLWLLPRYARTLKPLLSAASGRGPGPRSPLLAYLPLDGEAGSLSAAVLEGLRAYDGIAVYTEWARGELIRAFEACGGPPRPPVVRVGHGVDLECFRPPASPEDRDALARARAALKRRLLPGLDDPFGTLLVLNANRPDARKRIDLTLEGFADFLRRVPGARARLVLHHALTTPEVDASLRALADRLGIRSRVIFGPLGPARVADDAHLAELMAACEIGLNTSMGEGWGLLAFEHAATGAAQVLGRHSAHPELWEGAAWLVEPARRAVPRSSPLGMAELDARSVGEALASLYRAPDVLHGVALRCYARATEPRFTWDVAAGAFRRFLDVTRPCVPRPGRRMMHRCPPNV